MVRTTTIKGKNSPFVLYIDGILGRKYLVVLDQLSRTMAAKMDKIISHIQGRING